MKKTTQFDNNSSADTSKSQEEVIAKLKEENKNLQNELTEKNSEIQNKDTEIQTLKFKSEQLELQLQKTLLELYGSKADKAKKNEDPTAFDEPELPPDVFASELEKADEEITIPEHKRKKPGRKPLPERLLRKEVIHDLPDAEKICKGIAPGKGRIYRCLKANEAQLSADCKAHFKR